MHERTGARLHVISGGGPPDHHIAAFTTTTAWTAGSVTAIADWDVGIMPLRDGVYERAKCGYKLLQYAASAVPAVASPVGVNATLLDAMDGLAPTTVDEWTDALTAMLAEPAERRAEHAAAAADVAAAYSYARWEEAWVAAVGW